MPGFEEGEGQGNRGEGNRQDARVWKRYRGKRSRSSRKNEISKRNEMSQR